MQTGKVKYVAHPYYLGNPDMGRAVEAAWCAQDQGKYFEYQHALYENTGLSMSQKNLIALAGELGLDEAQFTQCLTSGQHTQDVELARQSAAARGVNSTPTFFINDRRIRGNESFEVFQRIIEQELARSQ